MRLIKCVVVKPFANGNDNFKVGEVIEVNEPTAFYEFTAGFHVVPTEKCVCNMQVFEPPKNIDKLIAEKKTESKPEKATDEVKKAQAKKAAK